MLHLENDGVHRLFGCRKGGFSLTISNHFYITLLILFFNSVLKSFVNIF